jgi:ATP:cob(I)alamin adenosyltransferase
VVAFCLKMKYKNITKKKGDGGTTDLCLGGRVPKTDIRIKTVGKLDTFHATMGLCHQYIKGSNIYKDFVTIQRDLVLLMGEIASDDFEKYFEKFGGLDESHLENLDRILEETAEELDNCRSQQKGWSYYGEKGSASAALDYAGTVCRECELALWDLKTDLRHFKLRSCVFSYMNRLSKVLYLYARKMEE